MRVQDSCCADGIFRNPKSWPPGFRFHPTDEELILYYLKRKICHRRIQLNVIGETDVYKWDPEELPGLSSLKSGDRQWYFFSPRDRKYPNGSRSNRATRQGYWKATGKDRDIIWNSRCVGNKKTLVFYKGRAPCGERTNWVMHEYTIDEKELKRCNNAKDYYVLYKLYKKSGAGPKNGEQYGAPFQEEDWADDGEYVEPERPTEEVVVPKPGCSFVDSLVNQDEPSIDDLDELLKQFVEEPEVSEPHDNGFTSVPPKVSVEVEPESVTMERSFGEAIFSEPSTAVHALRRQWDEQTSWNATQSGASFLLSTEAPEVISSLNYYEQSTHGAEEVGFLEVADLCKEKKDDHYQETSLSPTMTMASDVSFFGEIDDLNGPDVYHDAVMFLRDLGPIDQGAVAGPYFGFLGDAISGQLDFQPPPTQVNNNADEISSQLWLHDQRCNIFESAESNLVVMDPSQSALSVGVMNPSSSTNILSEQMPNRGGAIVGGGDSNSWLSSYVSSVLGSIPTRPALASENDLINRAFERMSSFGRVRIGPRETGGVAAGEDHAVERRVSRNKALLFFSLLGVLCAVLWMLLIGTTMKVLKTFLGRFISSW